MKSRSTVAGRPARGIGLLAGLCAAMLLPAGPASGQVIIRGDIYDGASGDPVAIAMVVLVDEGGRQVSRVISDESGRFVVRAANAGRYRIQVDRIGFRPYTSDPVEVAAGETAHVRLGVSSEAVRLEAVAVEGERLCRIPHQEGLLISDLWDEARKALELAVWTDGQPHLRAVVRSYERTLDIVTQRVLDERVRTWLATGRDPFFATPPEELAAEGYVRPAPDGGFVYHGLAPATILSRPFQDTHCFRVRPPGRSQPATEVGLAFEPAPGRSLPDVAGVLWIDTETSTLRRIEYTYTAHLLPVDVPNGSFGGRTELQRLDNGAVVIQRWWIRMPQFERVIDSRQLLTGVTSRLEALPEAEQRRQLRRVGLNIRAVGADAVSLALAGRPSRGTAAIAGVVHDSTTSSGLAGATVYIVGTDHEATSDESGRFTLSGLPSGEFDIAFRHTRLDLLGLEPAIAVVRLAGGDSPRVVLAIPSVATLLGGRCSPGEEWIAGFVHRRIDHEPEAGVQVLAEWDEDFRAEGQGAFRGVRQHRVAVTDRAGSYALCGVRPGDSIRVTAEKEDALVRRTEVSVPAGGGTRADFTLDVRP